MSKEVLKNSDMVKTGDRGPYITTFSGKKFYPIEPESRDIKIEDIAHALSNQCRWAGHCEYFYSVAQHSLHVSELVPEEYKLAALLHDASEAYLVDLPRPLKVLVDFSSYRTLEKKLQEIIYKKYRVDIEDYEIIKDADNKMLVKEAQTLMGFPDWAYNKPAAEIKIVPWEPKVAKKNFLGAFHKYEQ